jgi:hypothetical protein
LPFCTFGKSLTVLFGSVPIDPRPAEKTFAVEERVVNISCSEETKNEFNVPKSGCSHKCGAHKHAHTQVEEKHVGRTRGAEPGIGTGLCEPHEQRRTNCSTKAEATLRTPVDHIPTKITPPAPKSIEGKIDQLTIAVRKGSLSSESSVLNSEALNFAQVANTPTRVRQNMRCSRPSSRGQFMSMTGCARILQNSSSKVLVQNTQALHSTFTPKACKQQSTNNKKQLNSDVVDNDL